MAVLSAALLSAWVGVAPPATSEAGSGDAASEDSASAPASGPAASEGETERRFGWIQLAPLGLSVPGPRITPGIAVFDRAVRFGYRWGLAAGLMIEPIDHLMLGATASFDHSVWIFANDDEYELCFAEGCYGWRESGVGYLLRFGGDLRVGYTGRWLMAWIVGSPQIALAHTHLDCDNSVEEQCRRSENDIGPSLGVGLGLALRLTESFSLGLEGSIDHGWLDTRDDPFRAVRTMDLGLIGVVRF